MMIAFQVLAAFLYAALLVTSHFTKAWLVPLVYRRLHIPHICHHKNGVQALWRKPSLSAGLHLLPNNCNNENEDSGDHPKHWYSDTDPVVAVRWFAKAGVLEDEIKKSLKARGVKTLADLRERSDCALPFIKVKDVADFFLALSKAYQRIRTTAEDELGGQASYDSTLLSKECFNVFAVNAASIVPSVAQARHLVRGKNVTLVLGSSGSGKTMFALRHLPLLLSGDSDDDDDNKNCFSVHFSAGFAHFIMEENKLKSFPEAVASVVATRITDKLSDRRFSNVTVIDLHLHVIIDEAGGEFYRKYFDQESKLQHLVETVKQNVPFVFTKGVHVTVAGTGLDATVLSIPSGPVAIKIRMQPWTEENFDALLLAFQHSDINLVRTTVRDYPILANLITNGRCAYLLIDLMQQEFALHPDRAVVRVLVRRIADRYARTNALSRLRNTAENFEVFRSVFRELDKSTSQPDVPMMPQFDDMDDAILRAIANSLMDIHVDSNRNGEMILVNDSRFALSISSAVAISLIYLLIAETDINWDWHAFESTVMLSELKRMIVETTSIPRRFDKFVLQWPSLLIETDATTFSVPVMGNSTVLLLPNDQSGEYATVIAPYRLVQVKFAEDDSSVIDLDLQEELDVMGLTESPRHVLNQFLTNVLYHKIWRNGKKEVPDTVVKSTAPTPSTTTTTATTVRTRQECYPLNTLNRRWNVERPAMLVGGINNDMELFLTDERGKPRAFSRKPTEFDARHPVTAVFATNCQSFRCNVGEAAAAIMITANDVDWQGKLLEEKKLSLGVIPGLRKHVDLCFLFFGGH